MGDTDEDLRTLARIQREAVRRLLDGDDQARILVEVVEQMIAERAADDIMHATLESDR